jgi:hypothetical protein
VRIAKSITYVFSAAIEVVPCYKAPSVEFIRSLYSRAGRKWFIAALGDAKIDLGSGPRISSGAIFISSLREEDGRFSFSAPIGINSSNRSNHGVALASGRREKRMPLPV